MPSHSVQQLIPAKTNTSQAGPTIRHHERHESRQSQSSTSYDVRVGKLQQKVACLQLELQIARLGKDEDLEKERDELKQRLKATDEKHLAEQHQELNAEIDAYDLEVDELHQEAEERKAYITKLEDEVLQRDNQKAKVGQLEKELLEFNNLKDQVAKLEKEVLGGKTRVAAMAKQIIDRDHARKFLEAEVNRLKHEHTRLNETDLVKVSALEQEIRALREQLRAKDEEDGVADSTLNRTTTEEDFDWQGHIDQLEEANAALTADNKILRCTAVFHQSQVNVVEALEQQNAGLHTEIAEAAEKLREKDSACISYQQQAEALRRNIGHEEELNHQMTAPSSKPPTPPLALSAVHTIDTTPVKNPSDLSSIQSITTTPISPSYLIGEVGNPVVIEITIDPSEKANWTLLQKMRAAISRTTPIEITGPKDLVLEFQRKLHDVADELRDKTASIEAKQKLLLGQQKEIGRLEGRPACTVAEHRKLVEQVEALEGEIVLSNNILQQQGAVLRRFREREVMERREEERLSVPTAMAAAARRSRFFKG